MDEEVQKFLKELLEGKRREVTEALKALDAEYNTSVDRITLKWLEEAWSVEEVAVYHKVTPDHVRKEAAAGSIPGTQRIFQRYCFDPNLVKKWRV